MPLSAEACAPLLRLLKAVTSRYGFPARSLLLSRESLPVEMIMAELRDPGARKWREDL
jgi:hypothetical protein